MRRCRMCREGEAEAEAEGHKWRTYTGAPAHRDADRGPQPQPITTTTTTLAHRKMKKKTPKMTPLLPPPKELPPLAPNQRRMTKKRVRPGEKSGESAHG